jgi:hypothetical protein
MSDEIDMELCRMTINNKANTNPQKAERNWEIDLHEALYIELKKMKFIADSSYLKDYMTRNEKWELLCLICYLDGNPRYGIYDYIDMLKSKRCSDLTMLKFLRDRISCGEFFVVPGTKRSRKTLKPSSALMNEFQNYQEQGIGWLLSVIK